jgi:hypothetical protein
MTISTGGNIKYDHFDRENIRMWAGWNIIRGNHARRPRSSSRKWPNFSNTQVEAQTRLSLLEIFRAKLKQNGVFLMHFLRKYLYFKTFLKYIFVGFFAREIHGRCTNETVCVSKAGRENRKRANIKLQAVAKLQLFKHFDDILLIV